MSRIKIFIPLFILTVLYSCNSKNTNKMTTKKFEEAENTAVFTTKFVVVDKKDITTVYHEEEDGAWQFFSEDTFENFNEVAKVVGLGQIIKLDESILELADMPLGFKAHRNSKGEKWVIEKQK